MPLTRRSRCWLLTAVAVLAALASPCSAMRPGGDKGVVLSKDGNVVQEDGTKVEEYEVGERDRGWVFVFAARVHLFLGSHSNQYAMCWKQQFLSLLSNG